VYKRQRLGYNRDGSAITLPITLVGIRDTMISTSTSATANYYNNTIYIGGTGVQSTVANPSMGMCFATYNNEATPAAVATSVTRNVKNNLIINTRSNETTGGGHFAIGTGGSSTALANFSSNNNDFYVNGTGGVLGSFTSKAQATDMDALKAATGGDALSINMMPLFVSETSTTPDLHLVQTNYSVNEGLNYAAILASPYDLDFDGNTRKLSNRTIGSDEYFGAVTGVNQTEKSSIFVSTVSGNATLHNVKAGRSISVFNLSGQQLKKMLSNEGQTSFYLESGVYLIKVDNQIIKVVL
jgi:hypothetical protein